ncbi:MAG: riboflavin synthase [Desulfobulbaceae bacterium]|jgi:riboflavin synthase|nr:riboflavin synthase [Desulfobulbaceae bacterium]
MFTGIITAVGRLVGKRDHGGGATFELEAGFDLDDPREGESIACNGVCLTAYAIKGRRFCCDVSPETLARSNLGRLAVGRMLNMERALRPSDRLGGHIVSGHIDCEATVSRRELVGEYTLFTFDAPAAYGKYIVGKGSIAIDGISLTVNACDAGTFAVSIIPHTLRATTLGELRVGSRVNIEVDIIGKYVESLLAPGAVAAAAVPRQSMDAGFLARHGYL